MWINLGRVNSALSCYDLFKFNPTPTSYSWQSSWNCSILEQVTASVRGFCYQPQVGQQIQNLCSLTQCEIAQVAAPDLSGLVHFFSV